MHELIALDVLKDIIAADFGCSAHLEGWQLLVLHHPVNHAPAGKARFVQLIYCKNAACKLLGKFRMHFARAPRGGIFVFHISAFSGETY